MNNHTPGPWYVMNDTVLRKKAFMEAAPGITIAAPSNTEPVCRVSGYLQPLDANALLIAAAPELLAACHAVCHAFSSAPNIQAAVLESYNLCRSAIAKAEGVS